MGSSILGSRVLRTEDARFVTGEARYAEDVEAPGALRAVFVRSSMAHGRILGVEADDALAMPGVATVATAADFSLPRMWMSGAIPEAFARPVLAEGKVRFVGEPVAVVVAESLGQALDAVERVFVDLEELPPVVDPFAAASEEAAVLFPEVGTNVVGYLDFGDDPSIVEGADVVVRARIRMPPLAPVPLEVNSILVVPEAEGARLDVWVSTQNVFTVRDAIAEGLGMDKASVRVRATSVGGGFGAKIDPYPEFVVVAELARRLGRAVRWVDGRSESLTAMTQGRARIADIEVGATREGVVTGLRIDLRADHGAYPGLDSLLALVTFQVSSGPYIIPRVGFKVTGVVTSTTPRAAYRGAGRPEATLYLERAMDLVAAELGLDPAEVRRRNFIPPDAFPYMTVTAATYDSGDYERTLDEALRVAGYEELRAEQAARLVGGSGSGKLLGIGLSSYVEVTAVGPLNEFGSVEVHPDGSVTVAAGTGPTGQGHETSFAMLAAAALDVPLEAVTVVIADTGLVARGEGTYGSRSLQIGGSAVHQASVKVVEKARTLAAALLEAALEDVMVAGGRIGVAGAPERSFGWGELAEAASDPQRLPDGMEPGLAWSGRFTQNDTSFPFGSHVAVVEVDPETGQVDLRRMVAVDDCGRVLNPLLVEGQVHGGLAQGIAQALFEEVVIDEMGTPMNANLTSYEIPSAADLPWFEVGVTETPSPLNPLGAKGIAESATTGSTPAVQNAVIDALRPFGIRHLDVPLTPERVWSAVRDAREASAAGGQ
jgi:carbon-monoxide dehydrogenase large subunit